MPNIRISDLTPAGTITGTELVELVQGGSSVRSTVNGIVSAVQVPSSSYSNYSVTATSASSSISSSYASTTNYASNSIVAAPPYYNIACWGDSLTEGQGATNYGSASYPISLSLILGGRAVYNNGIGGKTATQIASTFLSFPSNIGYTHVIWAGINDADSGNYTTGSNGAITSVTSSITAMVNAIVSSGNNHFLLLSILNCNYNNGGTGSAIYNAITSSNKWMQQTYPNNYYDIRSYLVSQYNTSSTPDILAHNADIVPPSLEDSDLLHLNPTGYSLVAKQVAAFITGTLDQQTGSLLSGSTLLVSGSLTPYNLQTVFASPNAIGGIHPNIGTFSQLNAPNGAVICGTSNGLSSNTTVQIGYGQSYITGNHDNSVIIGYQASAGSNGPTTTTPTASGSVIIGYQAGLTSNSDLSVIIGYLTGQSATNCKSSTLIGTAAGNMSTNASSATLIGFQAGYSATTASNATLIGHNVLITTTNASNATVVGESAGQNPTKTNGATIVGAIAGQNSIDVSNSTIIGYAAGNNATTASSTVLIGYQAGYNSTNAADATVIGFNAGQQTKIAKGATIIGSTCGTNATNGTNATIIGYNAGANAAYSNNTVILGAFAAQNATTASTSIIIGYTAGQYSAKSVNSTLLGYAAGYNSITASNCTFLGANADTLSGSNVTSAIAIGYNAKVSGSNMCAIGGTGADAVKVIIGGTSAINTLDVVGNISCSVITASNFVGLVGSLGMSFGNGTSTTITPGTTVYSIAPYNCTITNWNIMGNQAGGTFVVDIWKTSSLSNTVPSSSNSICSGQFIQLSSSQYYISSSVPTNWTTSISKNDILAFYISASNNLSVVSLTIGTIRN